jgi:hypothetical protein
MTVTSRPVRQSFKPAGRPVCPGTTFEKNFATM